MSKAQFPRNAVRLAAIPVLAVISVEVVLSLLAKRPSSILGEINPQVGPWGDAAPRLEVLALGVLYFTGASFIFLKFLYDLVVHFGGVSRLRVLMVFLIGVATGVAVLTPVMLEWWPTTMDLVGADLFSKALEHSTTGGNDYIWGPRVFEVMRALTNIVTGLVVPAFAAGTISCLARFDELTEKENWIFQSERLRTYLYSAAGVLVVGVVFLKAWAGYPAFVLGEGARSTFVGVVNAYATYTGVEYSIVLASCTIPVALILSRRADRIAGAIAREENRLGKSPVSLPYSTLIRTVKERDKLGISFKEVVQALIALLAPFLTGSVATLTAFSA
jgi:hypothetical protein